MGLTQYIESLPGVVLLPSSHNGPIFNQCPVTEISNAAVYRPSRILWPDANGQ